MKLAALDIRNFGCIDATGYRILIDDIVIIIGPNNVGKSLVLDAYEAFASSGSALPLKCFRDEEINNTVEISGVFVDLTQKDVDTIGAKWRHEDILFGPCIKVMWRWRTPDVKGDKFSWDPDAGDWIPGGVGGWDSLIASRIPIPLRVRPTDGPEVRESQIVEILTSTIKTSLKKDVGPLAKVLDDMNALAESFQEKVQEDIQEACDSVGVKLQDVFPGHMVEFKSSVGKIEPEKIIGSGSHIRIKNGSANPVPLAQQGTGLQRAFLWSALAALAELGRVTHGKKKVEPEHPRILLIDEPESFLHPPMVRNAREALYGLARVNGWQVMASTHSPIFVDVSKQHTTIVRIGRGNDRNCVFATERSNFDGDDKTRLRMIRECHPSVNEFFFADHVFLVEGETERAILAVLLARRNKDNSKYHVVNCMGKANLPLFARILNQFGIPYTIIHDADSPKNYCNGKWQRNVMWTENERIIQVVAERSKEIPRSSTVVHVPDFETYYFGKSRTSDKPHSALEHLWRLDFETASELAGLRSLADSLISGSHPGTYSDMDDLKSKVAKWIEETKPEQQDKWDLS